jgi:hypothetical protein
MQSRQSATGNATITTLPATTHHLTPAPTQLGVAWQQQCQQQQQQPAGTAAPNQTLILLCTWMQQHSRSTL